MNYRIILKVIALTPALFASGCGSEPTDNASEDLGVEHSALDSGGWSPQPFGVMCQQGFQAVCCKYEAPTAGEKKEKTDCVTYDEFLMLTAEEREPYYCGEQWLADETSNAWERCGKFVNRLKLTDTKKYY